MTHQYSLAVSNARLDVVETTTGTGPLLRLYSGTKPANCAAAAQGLLLSSQALPSDWLVAAASGLKSISGTWAGSFTAAGTVGHFRIYNSAGTVCHLQGSVTAPGGGGDMTLSTLTALLGGSWNISTFTLTAPGATAPSPSPAPAPVSGTPWTPASHTAPTFPFTAPVTPTYTFNKQWVFDGTGDEGPKFNGYLAALQSGDRVQVIVNDPGQTIHHYFALGNNADNFTIASDVIIDVKGIKIDCFGPDPSFYCSHLNKFIIVGNSSTNWGMAQNVARGSSFFDHKFTFCYCTEVEMFDGASDGSEAALVYWWNCTDCHATRWNSKKSNADSFHVTGCCVRCGTFDCISANGGDDGFPIVDYLADATACIDCFHIRPTMNGNNNGRGLVVLGGLRCFIYRGSASYTDAAGAMIGCENNGDFSTRAPVNGWIDWIPPGMSTAGLTVVKGVLFHCNQSSSIDHGSALIINQRSGENFSVRLGGFTVTANNGRAIVAAKNNNISGALLDGSFVHDVDGHGSYDTGGVFLCDGQIQKTVSDTPASTGVTFATTCVATPG